MLISNVTNRTETTLHTNANISPSFSFLVYLHAMHYFYVRQVHSCNENQWCRALLKNYTNNITGERNFPLQLLILPQY